MITFCSQIIFVLLPKTERSRFAGWNHVTKFGFVIVGLGITIHSPHTVHTITFRTKIIIVVLPKTTSGQIGCCSHVTKLKIMIVGVGITLHCPGIYDYTLSSTTNDFTAEDGERPNRWLEPCKKVRLRDYGPGHNYRLWD